MPDLKILIFLFLICAFASFVQRTVGFGFGIIAMVFLPFFIGSYGEAVALSGLCSVLGTAFTAYHYRKKIDFKSVVFLSVGCMIMTLLATIFLKTQTNDFLVKMLGFILILTALYFIFLNGKIKIKPTVPNAIFTGTLSGILNGLFSTGGPPAVIYVLSAYSEDKEKYIGTIQAYFALTGIYSIIVRAANGFVTTNILMLLPFGIIGMFIGLFFGCKLFKYINVKVLKCCVYGLIAVSGVIMIIK